MSLRFSPPHLKWAPSHQSPPHQSPPHQSREDKPLTCDGTLRQMMSPTACRTLSRESNSRISTSRQSVVSSSMSTTTTALETDTGSDYEPLFRRQWDDEAEMDKGLKIIKRKQAAMLRLHKMNDVYDRLLEDKLKLLDTNFSHVTKELTKETRSIKEEIDVSKPVFQLPRIEPSVPVESHSAGKLSGRSQSDQTCQSCMFDPSNSTVRCRHFPCFLPVTYNSIGFSAKPQTYSVVENYQQLFQRCRDVRPATSKTLQHKADDIIQQESRAPRTTVKEKIRGLKQLVKEMKERNEKTKPRDWAINYGEPMPRRIILKPVKTI